MNQRARGRKIRVAAEQISKIAFSSASEGGGMRITIFYLAIIAFQPAFAVEGMWTFDNFPAAAVKQAYGVDVPSGWLDHVRLSTIRLTNCTASFVSPSG